MERIKFDYSLKNIPIPSKSWYQLQLIDKIGSVIKRMRWKAHFFLTNTHNANDRVNRETYSFKSKYHPGLRKELLKDNVTKTYKKSADILEKSINMEAKHVAKKLELSDRIEYLARNPAFITLKDHKENFNSKLPCRLINPSKTELGKVSKQKLEKSTKYCYNI